MTKTPIDGSMLLAFQHVDSQFPSGGFAFSQGLEATSQLADLLGDVDFASFLTMQIRHRWAEADRVALVRAHRLRGDLSALAVLDAEVEASTFMEGLRLGSRRNGTALLTAHARIGTPGATSYRMMIRTGSAHGHLPVVQGLLWQALDLDEATVVAISGYQAVSSLTTAALRLGLIGAIDAQRMITGVLSMIQELGAVAIRDDEPICSFIPLVEVAVALHGAKGQRLFSN